MIDLHCHILPGLDDGALTMEESLEMARAAVSEGITHTLATPHHMSYSWKNERQIVIHMVDKLQTELDAHDIPLKVFPGQEVRVYNELLGDIEKEKIQFVDKNKRYLLIEFPTSSIPIYVEELFFNLQTNGIIPIIVHPERNRMIQEHPNLLKKFIERGALAQLTAASYTGKFGKKIKRLSDQLIEANLIHCIASDAHNVTNRAYHLEKAYQILQKQYGEEYVERYKQSATRILHGEFINTLKPLSVKKKRIFRLFV